MKALLRSELRKLLTIRSTYIIGGLALVLVAFLAYYAMGYKAIVPNPQWLSDMLSDVSATIGIFAAIVAVLVMGHEYRYNTIMHTLTAANSRTKVLLAKLAVTVLYAVALLVVAMLVGTTAYAIGVAVSPMVRNEFVQPIVYWGDIWRALFYGVGYAVMGLLFIFVLRQIVGAIAALFIVPIIEELLTMLLKENGKYLPTHALEQVLHARPDLSPGKSALLFAAYMAGAWLITWYLFLRRDAN